MHPLTLILSLTALATPQAAVDLAKAKGSVRLDGSSTVFLISEAAAEEFKKAAPGVNVSVGMSGTGGGFKRFCAGEIDLAAASRAIKPGEAELAKKNGIEFIEVPIAFDGLSVVVNKDNTWCNSLTLDELKKIYSDGGAARWIDVRAGWPDQPIKIFSPGTDSGTFDYFREVVLGKDGAMRGDMSVSEEDNVLVRGVMQDKNAIGFFGLAYYLENKDSLTAVAIDGGKGAVAPTAATVEDGTYTPLGRPLFYYANTASLKKPQVQAFADFLIGKSGVLADEVGYIALPEDLQSLVRANWSARRVGSQFIGADGKPVHGTFRAVYK